MFFQKAATSWSKSLSASLGASQHKSSKLDILHSTCTIGRLTPVELNANLANLANITNLYFRVIRNIRVISIDIIGSSGAA